ncbi:MAG: diacylglycerol/lipid kinase family protein [Chloroflexota bacterium]
MTSTVIQPDEVLAPPDARVLHMIVNPAAGNGKAGRQWPAVERTLHDMGFNAEIRFTTGPDDAEKIARSYALGGARYIVTVGGDGTVNEAINGLIENGKPVNPETRFAVIPAGTGKDLSRSTGLRDARNVLRAIELDAHAHVDIASISFESPDGEPRSRYFINVADIGLGAHVAHRINNGSKVLGGLVSYFINAVQTIRVYEGTDISVTVDGEPLFEGPGLIVIFANGRFFAGGMRIAPDSSIRDGLLDIFVLEDVGRPALLTSLLPRVYFGKHQGCRGVHHVRGAAARIVTNRPLLMEMDGEQQGQTPVEVAAHPQILRLVSAGAALR